MKHLDHEDSPTNLEEQAFHNTVREYIIFLLLFGVLYVASYFVLRGYLHSDKDEDLEGKGEVMVRRVSLGVCTFALTVSVGAALLLPISVLSNEILLLYPSSYYVKWLNSSLISGLWNHVFLFSNLSIFVLLPFAYFFSESEGIGGQQGLVGRIYEAFIVQTLLAVIVLGMAFVLCALVDKSQSAVELFFDVWNYLPFLYSCLSFLGVVLLLLCTPLGFARLFTVLGQVIVKPNFLSDVNDEYYAVLFEESCLRKKYDSPHKQLGDGSHRDEIEGRLRNLEIRRLQLNQQRLSSPILRRLVYPLAMVLLLVLTTTALLNVVQNTLQLLVGIKSLPLSTSGQGTLGLTSLTKLGVVGALIEVALIGYLMAASTVGLYTLPFLRAIRPTARATPLTRLIVNCGLVLVLSSALPLLSRILGISNFDLLGNYGRIEWLGNFYLVLLYNLIFAFTAGICLAKKVTNSLLIELWRRLKLIGISSASNHNHHHRMLSPVARKMHNISNSN